MRYIIMSQSGEERSKHRSYEAARRQHHRNLAWRCGICGSARRGWGQCSHGTNNRVCSAEHYNDRIITSA